MPENIQGNILRLHEERVLKEELKLLLRSVPQSLVPAFLLASILYWGLHNEGNLLELQIWFFVLILFRLNGFFHARRHLPKIDQSNNSHGLVWTLVILNMIDAMIWGALPWLTLDTASMTDSVLLTSIIAAIVGSAMSRLSPVLPVFLVYASTLLFILIARLWTIEDTDYQLVGVASLLYLYTLGIIARNNSRELCKSINLRFENVALIDQLKEKTKIAETAKNEAEKANLAKSKFLAAASHDLRQPIHAQGLFMEVLSRTKLDGHQQQLLNSARVTSEDSSEMLNTLLDFSRIEAGVIEPHRQSFYLQPLFNKIEKELAPQADANNILYRSRETTVAVDSDPVLVELILRNLVTNAIRYTNSGGVLVACRRRGNQVVIEVWDTGIGIDATHQEEIFSEFHQLGNPERDRRKGLGLGLAIANGLARTLGHDLSINSTVQRGSVFRLSLPVAISKPVETATKPYGKLKLLNIRVLVIDDDPVVNTGMFHLLSDWGCECDVAESIDEAVSRVRANSPDVVICDYRLRDHQTGVEAIATLRKLLNKTLPAILITGDTAPERLRDAKISGVPLLHKPVLPNELYRKLVDVIQKDKRVSEVVPE